MTEHKKKGRSADRQPAGDKSKRGKARVPGKLEWTGLTEPSLTKAGATRKQVAKDGTRRGIDAHRGSPKLTDEVLEILEKEIESGLPVETACRIVKVWPSALQQRMEVDPDFAERIEQARARAEKEVFNSHLDLAYQGGRTSGTEFVLERQWPKHWKPAPKALETTGANGGPIEVNGKTEVVRYEYRFPANPIIGQGEDDGGA